MEHPHYEPIATLGTLGDFEGFHFLGSFRGVWVQTRTTRREDQCLAVVSVSKSVFSIAGVCV